MEKMNELSPRRFPRSPTVTPPRWRKPQDIMKKHKVKLKESALMARINSSPQQTTISIKRKNPFRWGEPVEKKLKEDLLEVISSDTETLPPVTAPEGSEKSLPLDWTLRTKIRFISLKPFPCSLTLKTCEEASGITGFVRCMDWNRCELEVDTSPNGRFHQSCLVWMQPNLPWVEVFPRHNLRRTGKPSAIVSDPLAKEALHRDWVNSFRSLVQLMRARHCPYFYMVGDKLTCLFRAAGVNGSLDMTAAITPTTKGFRKLLSNEGISYREPLRKDKTRKRRSSLDDEEEEEEDLEEELKNEDVDWLESLGIDQSTLHESQDLTPKKLENKDSFDDSLVCIDGEDIQALFNFLINCKSVISVSGPLAGIPPTLLSPVAFPGGTLTPLKVQESCVLVDQERYHSIEVRGPILPNSLLSLCEIFEESLDAFSLTLANIDSTKAFSSLPRSKYD